MTCKIVSGLVALVLTVTTVLAAIGAYKVYALMAIGSPDLSFALLTLAISVSLWLKVVKKMCPCKGAACSCPPGQCKC